MAPHRNASPMAQSPYSVHASMGVTLAHGPKKVEETGGDFWNQNACYRTLNLPTITRFFPSCFTFFVSKSLTLRRFLSLGL